MTDSRRAAVTRGVARRIITSTGCWQYDGGLLPNGYAYVYVHGERSQYLHRLSYAEFRGPIPEGLVIDHLCRNRACFNPEHLEAVPQRVNVHRGRSHVVEQAARTHCPQGHPYSPANTSVSPKGKRECRECHRTRQRERSRRMRAAGLMDSRGYRIYPEAASNA